MSPLRGAGQPRLTMPRLNWTVLPGSLGPFAARQAVAAPAGVVARPALTPAQRMAQAQAVLAEREAAAAIPSSRAGAAAGDTALLHVRGLSKMFGGLQAVADLDFDVHEGEILAMIGPNGAGKTTVFNMLTAAYRATTGTMTFRGHSLNKLAPHQVTKLGLVRTFQNLKLFPNMSALDNVKVARYCRTRAGLAAAVAKMPWTGREEREIEEFASRTLDFVGLSDQAFELARSLPYGDQKLLEIARALATEPGMILLDEPAAGLNSGESAELVKLVRRIREDGVTVMLIEHDMKVVMSISERIVVLDHGLKIAEGLPADVCRDQHVIDAYLGKAV